MGHLLPLLALALYTTNARGQTVGNPEDRLAACSGVPPPPSYADVAFLGGRQFVQAGAVNFSYFQFGPLAPAPMTEHPTLVLVAGQAATSSIWTPDLLRNLAQQREVVIFDNQGIGQSSPGPDNALDSYAAGIANLLEALELQQPDILGWSTGGGFVLRTAVLYPEAVRRLIIVASSAGGDGVRLVPELDPILTQVKQAIVEGTQIAPPLLYPDEPAGNAGLCRLLAAQQSMPPNQPTQSQSAAQAPVINDYFFQGNNDVYSNLGNITNPVLVMHGSQDAVVPLPNAFVLVEGIPGASLVQFADAGHALPLQHDQDGPAFIAAFLDAAVGDGAASA